MGNFVEFIRLLMFFERFGIVLFNIMLLIVLLDCDGGSWIELLFCIEELGDYVDWLGGELVL